MGFADSEKNKSSTSMVSELRKKFAPKTDESELNKKIQEEKDIYNNSNMSQNEFIDRLEQQKQEAEQKQEQDKANMYAMAIAFLKDLWSKKMSEAEQKVLQTIVEKKAQMQLAEYLQKTALEKQQIIAKTFLQNLKRPEVMKNAKEMAKKNPNLVKASKKAFGMTGNNIVNQFNFEERVIDDSFLSR